VLVSIDPGSAAAPYEQVRAQLVAAIESGRLAAEARLPTVRELAAELGLAVNTVARAYRELEAAGRVETRGRRGTYVTGQPSESRVEGRRLARAFVDQMRGLGLGDEETLGTVRRELGLGA
jgi:DNA-binding transcriptional regulator YhcF (GntR family)